MSWKLEKPLEENTTNSLVLVLENLARNGSYKADKAPIFTMNRAPLRYISGCLVTNLLESGIFIRNSPHENQIMVKGLET